MQSRPLIVFDMDGVLIDVSGSYRESVRQTARLFFIYARGWDTLPDPLFRLSDLAHVKQSGGLNNDWDLSFAVIALLTSLASLTQIRVDADPWVQFEKTLSGIDVAALRHYLDTTSNPLTTLLQNRAAISLEPIKKFYTGDVGTGNIIKQIFQEIYLGKKLFEATYNMAPKLNPGTGLIHKERLLIPGSLLKPLARHNTLAIATGRPKAEAEFALHLFDIRRYFTTVLTLDDCLAAEGRFLQSRGCKISLGKPHPFMLDTIGDQIIPLPSRYYYVGDMPDDMLAAARSKYDYIGIGTTQSAPQKRSLRSRLAQAGAGHIVDDPQQLLAVFESAQTQ